MYCSQTSTLAKHPGTSNDNLGNEDLAQAHRTLAGTCRHVHAIALSRENFEEHTAIL